MTRGSGKAAFISRAAAWVAASPLADQQAESLPAVAMPEAVLLQVAAWFVAAPADLLLVEVE